MPFYLNGHGQKPKKIGKKFLGHAPHHTNGRRHKIGGTRLSPWKKYK